MRTKNSTDSQTTVDTTFKLTLPAEIEGSAKWTVPLSHNSKAYVYEIKTQDKDEDGKVIDGQFSTSYAIRVANNKTSLTPRTLLNHGAFNYYRGTGDILHISDLLAVAGTLRAMSAALQPKKTKVTRVDETDGDDE